MLCIVFQEFYTLLFIQCNFFFSYNYITVKLYSYKSTSRLFIFYLFLILRFFSLLFGFVYNTIVQTNILFGYLYSYFITNPWNRLHRDKCNLFCFVMTEVFAAMLSDQPWFMKNTDTHSFYTRKPYKEHVLFLYRDIALLNTQNIIPFVKRFVMISF